jgi:peptide/nickel transport system ATP-binding protein
MSAVPQPDPKAKKDRIVLKGELPSPENPPSGCYFHPRCRYAQEICQTDRPVLEEIQPNHFARCHFARQLNLRGALETANVSQPRTPTYGSQIKPGKSVID